MVGTIGNPGMVITCWCWSVLNIYRTAYRKSAIARDEVTHTYTHINTRYIKTNSEEFHLALDTWSRSPTPELPLIFSRLRFNRRL